MASKGDRMWAARRQQQGGDDGAGGDQSTPAAHGAPSPPAKAERQGPGLGSPVLSVRQSWVTRQAASASPPGATTNGAATRPGSTVSPVLQPSKSWRERQGSASATPPASVSSPAPAASHHSDEPSPESAVSLVRRRWLAQEQGPSPEAAAPSPWGGGGGAAGHDGEESLVVLARRSWQVRSAAVAPTFGKPVKDPIPGLQDSGSDTDSTSGLLHEEPSSLALDLSDLQINSDQDGMFVIIDGPASVPSSGSGKGLHRVQGINDKRNNPPSIVVGPELAGRSKAEAEWGAKRYLAKAKVWILSEQYLARILADDSKAGRSSSSTPNGSGSLGLPGVNLKGVKKMFGVGGKKAKKEKAKADRITRLVSGVSFDSYKDSFDSDDGLGSHESFEKLSARGEARDDSVRGGGEVTSRSEGRGRRRREAVFSSTTEGVLDGEGRRMQGMALDGHGGVYLCEIAEDIKMNYLLNVSSVTSCEPCPLPAPDQHTAVVVYIETPKSPELNKPLDLKGPTPPTTPEQAREGKSSWMSLKRKGSGSQSSLVRHPSLNSETDGSSLRAVTIAFETKDEMEQWVTRLKPSKVEKAGKVHVFAPVRAIVSGNRRRFQDGVYDLDLSYISPMCIAMSFPAEDTVGPFSVALRNKLTSVRQFFDEKHKDLYKIFNLCAEKTYDEQKFGGRVEHVPFLDHHPPSLRQIKHFVYTAEEWRKHRSGAVCAVHCKGGKGRTGAMVACWLLRMGEAEGGPIHTAQDAIDVFVAKRTLNMNIGKPQGPTGAGQRRYVGFYERALREPVPNRPVQLLSVTVRCVPSIDEKFRPVVRVMCLGREVYFGVPGEALAPGTQKPVVIDLTAHNVYVNEDISVYIFNGAQKEDGNEQKLADCALVFLCTHTGMEGGESPWKFDRGDLDGAIAKDKEGKVFLKHFGVDIAFKERPALQKYVAYDEDIEDMVMKHVGETRAVEFKAGAVVCHMGDVPESDLSDLYIVQTGSVRSEKLVNGEPIVKERNARIFGEAGFLLGTPRASDVVTNKDSKIWVLSTHVAEHVMQREMYSLYHLLCLKVARKLSKPPPAGAAGQMERKTSALQPALLGLKYVQRYNLPNAENAVVVSAECVCSKTDTKDAVHGKIILLNKYIVFDAKGSDLKADAKAAAGRLIRLRHVVDVRWSPKSLSVSLVFRPTDPKSKHETETIELVMNDEETAHDVSAKIRSAAKLQRNFRLAGSPISAEMIHRGAVATLPELFGPTSIARVHVLSGGSVVGPAAGVPENSLLCLIDGIALVKAHGAVTDRIERGDMLNIVRFMHQINYVRHKLPITFEAGPDGATIAAVSFDFIRSLLEQDSAFALRFYEYSAKVMARQLYDSWSLE